MLRYTVNAIEVTAISALRGEHGSSLQISMDMKSTMFYIKHILLHNNLLKTYCYINLTKNNLLNGSNRKRHICKILTSTFMQ